MSNPTGNNLDDVTDAPPDVSHNETQVDDEEAATALNANGNDELQDEPATNQKKPAIKHEKDFRDVANTGKWGAVTTKELYVVAGLIITIAVAAIIVIILIVGDTGDNQDDVVPMAPTMAPTSGLDATAKLQVIRDVLTQHGNVTNVLLAMVPTSVQALFAMPDDEAQHAVVRAAQWAVFTDNDRGAVPGYVANRFALAAVYYAMHGMTWKNTTHWLAPDVSVCDWHGIGCNEDFPDHDDAVVEIDLSYNNLTGTIPGAMFTLLDSVRVLGLDGNLLSGTIPGVALGAMAELKILYLQNNRLTGTIPPSLIDTELHTLYVQGNNLTGTWPFCPDVYNDTAWGPDKLYNFGLDCEQTPCPDCCSTWDNCFQ